MAKICFGVDIGGTTVKLGMFIIVEDIDLGWPVLDCVLTK